MGVKQQKKEKKRTTEATFVVDVDIRRLPFTVVLACVVTVRRRHSSCCWPRAGEGSCASPSRGRAVAVHRCWVRVSCAVCSPRCVLRFCNRISGRVGLSQPNTYHAKNKKVKAAIPHFPQFRHGTTICNPQRHRYSVTFF